MFVVDFCQAIGLALETRRMDIFEDAITKSVCGTVSSACAKLDILSIFSLLIEQYDKYNRDLFCIICIA